MNIIKFGNMEQEDKNLLLKDLCGRLPYKPMVHCESDMSRFLIDAIDAYGCVSHEGMKFDIEKDGIKPYLFPLSLMTEEQILEIVNIIWPKAKCEIYLDLEERIIDIEYNNVLASYLLSEVDCWGYKAIDYLNANNLDYRGLIKKSLALDATGLNIYYS